MVTRKLGKLIVGRATPFQVITAAVLGSVIGFMPGLHAAGMVGLLVVILFVANTNLFVATLAGLLARLLALVLMPLSVAAGRALLEGPAEPAFGVLVNAPGTALLGLEYHAVSGGLVVGTLVGLAIALPILWGRTLIRRRLAELESSDRYQQMMNRWWVQPLVFLLLGVGKRGRARLRAEFDRPIGLPFRPLAIVGALLLVATAGLLAQFASEPIVTAALIRGLERVNGATVDVRSARLDLTGNRLVVNGLAMADPNDLDTDLLRAARLEADLGGLDLLRKRLVLDHVVVVDATHGERRVVPGRRVEARPDVNNDDDDDDDTDRDDAEPLDTYLRTAGAWKERLTQVREWLDVMTGSTENADGRQPDDGTRRRVPAGAGARADHLVHAAPLLLIGELVAEGVRSDDLPPDETLAILGRHLSTHPARHPHAPHLEIRSSGGTIDIVADLGSALDSQRSSTVRIGLRGLPIDTFAEQWRTRPAPMAGGAVDAVASLTWAGSPGGAIDAPLDLTLRATTLTVGGRAHWIDELQLPVRIGGRLDDPRISMDADALVTAIREAGEAELVGRARAGIDPALDEAVGDASYRVKREMGRRLGDLLGEGEDDAPE